MLTKGILPVSGVSASDALQRLIEGNDRFVLKYYRTTKDNKHSSYTNHPIRSLTDLVAGQSPFAIILGCSDSRAPAEIIFDQGLGDLFVIRVAGNIIAPSLVSSIEFAVERFGTRLAIVLGHSHCGAVQATLDELQLPEHERSAHLAAIVKRIQPAVEPLIQNSENTVPKSDALIAKAVKANIMASCNQLTVNSLVLSSCIKQKKLYIVGAEYALQTGKVNFFHGVSQLTTSET